MSDANSPMAHGSSMKLGTMLGSAVVIANIAFSRATVVHDPSTTGLRNAGNCRASASVRSSCVPQDVASTVAAGIVAVEAHMRLRGFGSPGWYKTRST